MSHTCVVTNQTGNSINVQVRKFFGSSPDGGITATPLAPGGQTSFDFHGGTNSGDYWSLVLNIPGVGNFFRDRKRCDVEQEDLASPVPIFLNLLAPAQGFSVEMPKSSSCTDNAYESGSPVIDILAAAAE